MPNEDETLEMLTMRTTAVDRKEGGNCLREEQRREDINSVLPVKMFGGYRALYGVVQVPVSGHASIVDENINLQLACRAEVLLRGCDDRGSGLFRFTQIGLHVNAANTVG